MCPQLDLSWSASAGFLWALHNRGKDGVDREESEQRDSSLNPLLLIIVVLANFLKACDPVKGLLQGGACIPLSRAFLNQPLYWNSSPTCSFFFPLLYLSFLVFTLSIFFLSIIFLCIFTYLQTICTYEVRNIYFNTLVNLFSA